MNQILANHLKNFKNTPILSLNHKGVVALSSEKEIQQFNFFLFTDKFINLLMRDGKKVKAAKLFFDMLLVLKKRLDKDTDKKSSLLNYSTHDLSVLHFLSQAVDNVTPSLEVRKVRVAGTTYLVPAILSKKRQQTRALGWIIESAKKRQNNSKFGFSECLADEIFDASKKQGGARQKRDELHRLAEANRAYIRYRWW
jgi:small subunit ribosomal protein S7